jgi:serine/threonine-protein kinase
MDYPLGWIARRGLYWGYRAPAVDRVTKKKALARPRFPDPNGREGRINLNRGTVIPHPPTATPVPPDEPPDPLLGTPYAATARIGQGGMGEVFAAVHRGLNKPVVVKLLHARMAHDPRFADRLRVEAQALAAVTSEHVVSVSDLGLTPAGRPYVVMDRLQGRTLRQELDARGALPVLEAIGIVVQILKGLGAAHQLGIIHRDVKPDNVFLCFDPEQKKPPLVKVLDFGIAKIQGPSGPAAPVQAAQYATEEGVLIGSPRFVAPEQVRFQAVDARTDVYAVGLILYTLIAGRGPFAHAADMLELLNAHVAEAPRAPSCFAAQVVAPELDRAILKALAKQPDQRFASADAFADELRRVAAQLAGTEPTLRLVLPAPAPATPAEADEEAWFAPEAGAPPLVELPWNLTPQTPRAPPVDPRTFAVLTLASTVLFSVIAALLLRAWGPR